MQDSLRARISALEQEKGRIVQFHFMQNCMVESIHSKRKTVSDLISQARQETLDFVNKFYDGKEKEIQRKMEADEKKLGLHN